MSDSRSAATDRLRREGRWKDATTFRDEKRRELKKGGMTRVEAVNASWEAMLEQFPPLPTAAVESAYGPVTVEMVSSILNGPANATPVPLDDVAWVYDHLGDEGLAPADFPGLGAWSMWNWARANRARFYERLWPAAEAARANGADGFDDPFWDEAKAELAKYQAYWMNQLADDPLEAVNCLAFHVLLDLQMRFQGPSPSEHRARFLAYWVFLLARRYLAASREKSDSVA